MIVLVILQLSAFMQGKMLLQYEWTRWCCIITLSIEVMIFTVFPTPKELLLLSPCKAADLVAIHFTEQIESIIANLQVQCQSSLMLALLYSEVAVLVRNDGWE